MKWNGRTYKPANAQYIRKKKEFDFQEALKSLGEKEMPVWNPVIGVYVSPSPQPQPSPTNTPTNTNTPTPSITASATPGNTPTATPSNTPSNTPSVTPSITASVTPTITATNTPTNTSSNTPSVTPSITPTNTPSNTPSTTPSNTPSITPSNTPSITPSNTPSNTPSITPTNTPTPSTSALPSGTTEANTFLIAARNAKGSDLGSTVSAATTTLFTSLVSNNLWDKMIAFYPAIGGVSGSIAINGFNPGTYDLAFNGGWTFTTSGATPNGTNAYANTGLNDNSILSLNDTHIAFYSRTASSSSGFDICVQSGTDQLSLICRQDDTGSQETLSRIHSDNYTFSGFVGNTGSGFYIGTRDNSSTVAKIYRNGVEVASRNENSIAKVNNNIYISARNNAGSVDAYNNKQWCFISIGYGLDATEASNLSTIVNTFNTSLTRNTY